MDKSVIKRIAIQTGLMPGSDMEKLEMFANACAAWRREQDAGICRKRIMGDNNREDQEAKRCMEAILKG